MEVQNFDFSGWATRNDVRCSDGRTIRKDAFIDDDGKTVPLVWNHQHSEVSNVLGHALLVNKPEGVYAYGKFNDTQAGRSAKIMVDNGDITSLSIYANNLKQNGGDVMHGIIRELSLVLAGANPGAFIDTVMAHGMESDEEAYIYSGEEISISHACASSANKKEEDCEKPKEETTEEPKKETTEEPKEESEPEEDDKKKKKKGEESDMNDQIAHVAESEETVEDVFNSLSEKQKTIVYAIVGQIMEDKKKEQNSEGGKEDMVKHNLFENDQEENTLVHDGLAMILKDAKRCGSLKESYLQHAEEYGIKDIEWLFPEAKNVNGNVPGFIKRMPDAWVGIVMNGVHKTPFAKIKMMFADITADEARAKGYIKGKRKKEEVFTLLKRTVTPTTIYKKQKLDRDDIVDITDFDVVSWIKAEMRIMLDEEIARAVLVGDGRLSSSDDKISETNIIPIAKDDDLYALKYEVTPGTSETFEHAFITSVVKAQDDYQGSGNITLFVEAKILTGMLLIEDKMGRRLYNNVNDVANALNVDRIAKVPKGILPEDIYGIAVDLKDYNIGADKGGAINMFDDFDIDYNQQKYLMETRCSGALVKPYSALVFKKKAGEAAAEA